MSYHGVRNWPPVWTYTANDHTIKTVRGEVGTLAYVHSNALASSRCFIVIDYEGEMYVGSLLFDSQTFCKQVGDILKIHLKWSIKDIGDLDLSHTL